MPESLASTLAAFANARGGIVILGLDERQGFVAAGVPDAAALRNAAVSAAREKLTPSLAPSVEIVPFEGVNLIVAEVEALPPAQRPCYVTTRGLHGGAYVRVGDGDQRMTPYEIDRLRENAGPCPRHRRARRPDYTEALADAFPRVTGLRGGGGAAG